MSRHVARIGKMRNAYNILVRKSEGRRQLRRHMHRREINVRIYLRKIG